MKIVFASDHVGYELKLKLMDFVSSMGHDTMDVGTHGTTRTDYPIWGSAAALEVMARNADRGIILCGTGVGIGIAANKINGIRCVTCSDPYSAELSRMHNNTNMLSMGARVVGDELAKMITRIWLQTEFEGGRHQRRLDEISELETRQRTLRGTEE